MRKSNHQNIRDLLRFHRSGLSIDVIANKLQISESGARGALMRMPDAYIDRWQGVISRDDRPVTYKSIWRVVEVPADAPHPNRK